MKIECPQWKDCGIHNGGCCQLGKYGGTPSNGVCTMCLGGIVDTTDLNRSIQVLSIESKPYSEWPLWAKCIAKSQRSVDKGVGDTVARLLGKWGERFKSLMTRLGAPCGCTQRQAEWNILYPYEKAHP